MWFLCRCGSERHFVGNEGFHFFFCPPDISCGWPLTAAFKVKKTQVCRLNINEKLGGTKRTCVPSNHCDVSICGVSLSGEKPNYHRRMRASSSPIELTRLKHITAQNQTNTKEKSTALKSKCGISDLGRAAVLTSALPVVWYPVLPTRPLCVLGHIAEAVTWRGPLLVGPRLRCVLLNYEKMGFAWKPHWASLRGTFCSHVWAADRCVCLRGLLRRAWVPPWSEIIWALLPIHSLLQVQFLSFFFKSRLIYSSFVWLTMQDWHFSPMFAVGSCFLISRAASYFNTHFEVWSSLTGKGHIKNIESIEKSII